MNPSHQIHKLKLKVNINNEILCYLFSLYKVQVFNLDFLLEVKHNLKLKLL